MPRLRRYALKYRDLAAFGSVKLFYFENVNRVYFIEDTKTRSERKKGKKEREGESFFRP